jgi:hypothetical protein
MDELAVFFVTSKSVPRPHVPSLPARKTSETISPNMEANEKTLAARNG